MSTIQPPPPSPTPSHPTPPPRPTPASTNVAPRFSQVHWLPLSLLRPALAVRVSDHAGWLGSWAVHLLGLVMGVFVITFLNSFATVGSPFYPLEVIAQFNTDVRLALREIMRDSHSVVFTIAGVAAGLLGIHLATAFAGVALMPWTACGDEPVRKSFARAVQRLWRLTPFAAILVLLLGLAIQISHEIILAFTNMRRWEIEQYTTGVFFFLSTAWPLAVLLLALYPGVERARCRWPAACEGCGYNLLGLDATQSCPECGLAVEQSTAAQARPGSPWATCTAPRGWRFWRRTVVTAVTGPTRLGRSLHLLAPSHHHRTFFAAHLVLAALTAFPGVAGFICVFVTIALLEGPGYGPSIGEIFEIFFLVSLMFGSITLIAVAGVGLMGAGVVGRIASWVHGRNLLPAAMQGAAYLSGYKLLWVGVLWVFSLCAAVFAYILFEYFGYASRGMATAEYVLSAISLTFLALNLVLLAVYLVLLWRITRGARHANW